MNYQTILSIILSLSILIFIIALPMYMIILYEQPKLFKEACENFQGYYYELQNTSCKVMHENCLYTCRLNNKIYDLDSLGFGTSQSFNKYFCVEDCRYKNKDGLVCVC